MRRRLICCIPARAGSKRIPDKNLATIGPESLVSASVRLAVASTLFDDIFLITDSDAYQKVATGCGSSALPLRPAFTATDEATDFDWLLWFDSWYQNQLSSNTYQPIDLCILRPTSPFRSVSLLRDGLNKFKSDNYDSARCVSSVTEPPFKCWVIQSDSLYPLIPLSDPDTSTPYHSSPSQRHPKTFVQNAALEFLKSETLHTYGNITGAKIAPIVRDSIEVIDVNNSMDLMFCQWLYESGHAKFDF